MPFFGLEPFDTAEAEYFWTGLGQPGFQGDRSGQRAKI
jgi:hypothetical protein